MERQKPSYLEKIGEVTEWIPVAVGIDLAFIKRFEKICAYEDFREKFLKRIFTQNEVDELYRYNSDNIAERIAVRFAAKEAVSKALGTGISHGSKSTYGVHWKDIEVLHETSGAPYVKLYNKAEKRAQEKGIQKLLVSLTHDGDYAGAVVIAAQPFAIP